MNASPVFISEPNLSLLLKVLFLVGFIVAMTVAISWRRQPSAAGVLAKLGVVGVALLVVGGFVSRTRQAGSFVAEVRPPRVAESQIASSASSSTAAELESTKADLERPEWTRQPVRVDGRRKLVVVSSGRFASEEEAELHGFQQAAVVAVKDYSSLDPRGIGDVQPQHADLIKDSAISNRFMESISFDFGKFQAPMHQLWLEVALTPELGERLAEPWRRAAVESRLRTLGGWSVWGTAAAALAAFGLRLDSAWNGRRRLIVAGSTIALALGVLAFV